MTTKVKTKPRVGDECWFVQWAYELAWVDGDSTSADREVDRDECKEHTRRCETKKEAERIAKQVYPETINVFGFVEYWPARFEAYDDDDAIKHPTVGCWVCIADPEEYSGEES